MWNCWVRALPTLERRDADLQPRGADLPPGHLISPIAARPSLPARRQQFGEFCATSYYWQVSDGLGEGGQHSAFLDKPVFYSTP